MCTVVVIILICLGLVASSWSRSGLIADKIVTYPDSHHVFALYEWLSRCRHIYDLCGLTGPLLMETSIKVNKNKINPYRHSLFIPGVRPETVPLILHVVKTRPPSDVRSSDLMYGVDLARKVERLYWDPATDRSVSVMGSEWKVVTGETCEKKYVEMDIIEAGRMLAEMPVREKVLQLIPIDMWDVVGRRQTSDAREALYISYTRAPRVSQVRKEIEDLAVEFNKDLDELSKWLDHYADCTVHWVAVSLEEMSVYVSHTNVILDGISSFIFAMTRRWALDGSGCSFWS